MDDFERRLASRLAAYEESVPYPTAPEERVGASRSRFSRWVLLVPVVAVVVIGVASGIVGSGFLTGVRPVGNGPVTSLEWTTHAFVPGARVVGLATIGDRLIATGSLDDDPAAWYSDDGGRTWTAASVDPAPPNPGGLVGMGHALGAIAKHGEALVALDAYTTLVTIGSGSVASRDETARTLSWTSRDNGATWEAHDGISGSALALTATANGFAAFGIDGGHGVIRGWTSSDGAGWAETEIDGIGAHSGLGDAAFDGSQLLLAGGDNLSQKDGQNVEIAPSIWTSADGRRWTPRHLDKGALGVVRAIDVRGSSISLAGGLYQPGGEDHQRPVVWTSGEGASWDERYLPVSATAAPSGATGVAGNDLGLLVRETRYGSHTLVNGVWFLPSADPNLATEQGMNRDVAALAALPDRFVLISQCDANGSCESPTVSIGKPIQAAPRVSSPTETTAHATPTLQPTPQPIASAALAADMWPAATIASGDGVTVRKVIEAPDGLIAVGSADGGGAIWRSHDGLAWQRITDVPPVPADRTVQLTAVTFSPMGYVATGVWGPRSSEVGGAVVWTSSDGTHWRDGTNWSESASIRDIIPTDAGFLAVGGQSGLRFGNGVGAWTSSDGVNWTEASVGNGESATMLDVIAVADGFVSVGLQRDNTAFRPAVWRSSDGLKWEQVAAPAGGTDGAMSAVAASDGVLVAIGASATDAEADGMIWRSTDRGISWERVYNATCCHALTGLAATTAGFVATGTATDGSGTVTLASRDGSNWAVEGVIAPTSVDGLVATERFGLLAWSGTEGEANPVYSILFAPPPMSPMSRDEAIAAASSAAGGGSDGVKSAQLGRYEDLRLGPTTSSSPVPPSLLVWRVEFDYQYPDGSSQVVLVDAYSGQLVEATGVVN